MTIEIFDNNNNPRYNSPCFLPSGLVGWVLLQVVVVRERHYKIKTTENFSVNAPFFIIEILTDL